MNSVRIILIIKVLFLRMHWHGNFTAFWTPPFQSTRFSWWAACLSLIPWCASWTETKAVSTLASFIHRYLRSLYILLFGLFYPGLIDFPIWHRLTPVYAVILGFIATLLAYLGSGPNWQNVRNHSLVCRSRWWTNLLYINNFLGADVIME